MSWAIRRRSEIIVVCGGCDNDTAANASEAGESVKVIEESGPSTKAAGLNFGVAAAAGDLVVFADARQVTKLDV